MTSRLDIAQDVDLREAHYLYDAADMRVYKRRNKVNGAVETQAFHLRDAAGRELGVLDLAGGNDPGNNDPLTGAWTWYAFGAQRFAKITPQQQPPLLTSDLGRWGQIDPDQAIYQALLTWLVQQNAQPGGISLPQTPYFVQHLPGGAYTHYTQADYVAAAQDPGFAALPYTTFRLTDMRTQVSLKRHGSEEPILVSIEVLLGMGQAKSGNNGVPFTYTNAYASNSLDQVTYYLHDHLGNMRVTYTAGCKQEQGNAPYRELTLEHAADYHPYGSILREWRDGEPEKYLSTHHERDTETGLDYRGARYYDAEVARFLSLDPNGGDYASWSAYNYVLGKPTSVIDPDGRDGWDIIKGAFAAWADNQAPANPNPYAKNIRERMSYSNASHYNLGQDIGDIVSSVIGAVEVVSGLRNMYTGVSAAAGGVALAPVSAGASAATVSVAGAWVALMGLAQAAHGGMVVLNAVENMGNGKGRVPESGSGRGSNNRKPDGAAQGDHSVINESGNTTYRSNPKNPTGSDEVTRTDVRGGPHKNPDKSIVPTPHVHTKGEKGVRPAVPGKDYGPYRGPQKRQGE